MSRWYLPLAALALASAARADADGLALFEKKIRPVLVEHCYKCHSAQAKKARGGLALDTRAGLLAGGDTGPAVVPGDPKKSRLLAALRHQGPKMPSDDKKLPDGVIADFEEWVRRGAPDPRDGSPAVKKGTDLAEGRKHWAYQPVRSHAPPAVKATAWPANDVDRFVLARVEAKGLSPAADAPRHALIRRATYDLTGLPPTPEEAAAFEADADADAFAKVVDRLLRSPRFGEHWARHWLDGVRYNLHLPTVDRYRDWVIDALDDDKPYDRFVLEQLAGDLLEAGDDKARDANLVATQMLCFNSNEMDPVEGMIEVVGQHLLGVSVNCAKCHDHKFDAYSQRDYYALAGVFTSSRIAGARKGGGKDSGLVALKAEKGEVVALVDARAGDTNLLNKGDPKQKLAPVPRRFPAVLAGDEQTPLGKVTRQSGRLELAKWIADGKNPLTARVMANRVWQRLLGKGIVGTPNDFGTQGDAPTHPELLDHLAASFVREGWSLKKLIRLVVLSRTYRQSSRPDARAAREDLTNALVTRVPLRRLSYEQMQDGLYFVAGRLDLSRPGFVKGNLLAPKGKKKGDETSRRAIFSPHAATARAFDAADPDLIVEQRGSSVTGPQLLFFLNNPAVVELAAEVAKRAEKGGNAGRVEAAYRLLLARPPSPVEARLAAKYLEKATFARYCHALMMTNEFVYLD